MGFNTTICPLQLTRVTASAWTLGSVGLWEGTQHLNGARLGEVG